MAGLIVTSARVDTASGRIAATIDLIEVGGGSQTVTVDGTPEERIHPARQVWHVRLLSPDRMLSDELREVDSYEKAVDLAQRYADRVDANADRLKELADDLKV